MKKDAYIIIGTAYLECDEEIIKTRYLKNSISVSNTVFERKLFNGFKENGVDVVFLSCPHLGYYPTSLKKAHIKGLTSKDDLYCLDYNAFIGYSSLSKRKALTKQLKNIIDNRFKDNKVHLIISEAHKPYLDVAQYAKKKHLVNDVTIMVPDLPEHNIRSKNFIYKLLKKNNVSQIHKKIDKYVDKFVFFTKPMIDRFNLINKQFIVSEGISSGIHKQKINSFGDDKIHLVFIGKLDERNGVGLIYEAAQKIQNNNVVFDLYGVGGTELDASKKMESKNVIIHGFLKPSDVKEILTKATILLSPRFSNQEYTKYSFPSKMFDYLEAFKPIITFKLESYPDELDKMLYYPKAEDSDSLLDMIKHVLENDELASKRENDYSAFINKYDKKAVAKSIIDLIKKEI